MNVSWQHRSARRFETAVTRAMWCSGRSVFFDDYRFGRAQAFQLRPVSNELGRTELEVAERRLGWARGGVYALSMTRFAAVVASHEDAAALTRNEAAAMTKEERLALSAALHAYWVRNWFPEASGLDRAVRVLSRPER